jgi:3-hydroxyisobutyrate dehydrogenase-like beta-hydroxyacid dehydrogenase
MKHASYVSVIGLGSMGSALAAGLLAGGQQVTVWNRTEQRISPLVELGASRATAPAAAIESSPITIVCVRGTTWPKGS